MSAPFEQSLKRDPSVALPTQKVASVKGPGPLRGQQLIIELVGPRTVPAQSVKAALNPEWQQALARPEVYVMAGADNDWRPLNVNDASGAYDSIALCWDLVTPQGEMTQAAAQGLWNVAEDLARQLSRRALAMPIPSDIGAAIRVLKELRESLDIGVNLSVVAGGIGFEEHDIWAAAAALGLDCAPSGQFRWLAEGSEWPLFEVNPIGDNDRFSLGQAQHGTMHAGIGLGFSVPLCPDPPVALEGCLKAAKVFAERLRGTVWDEEDRPLTPGGELKMRSNLGQAVGALTCANLAPGSREAIKMFAG